MIDARASRRRFLGAPSQPRAAAPARRLRSAVAEPVGPQHPLLGRGPDRGDAALPAVAVVDGARVHRGRLSQDFKANGSTDPDDQGYRALAANGFADWRLQVGGLVERPMESFSLADLREMPARTQITRHDCVEGWSCIGKWTGVQLAKLLDLAGLKPETRYILFTCADELEKTLDGSGRYYETIDLEDAFHPQTILAYDMNGAPLDDRPWCAAARPGRAAARLQDGEIRHAHRRDRQFRQARPGPGKFLGGSRLRLVRRDLSGRRRRNASRDRRRLSPERNLRVLSKHEMLAVACQADDIGLA